MVRIKQRYILGELLLGKQVKNNQVVPGSESIDSIVDGRLLSQKNVQYSFRNAVLDAYGDFGLAQVQPNLQSKCHSSSHSCSKILEPVDSYIHTQGRS